MLLRERNVVRVVSCGFAAVLVVASANQVLAREDTRWPSYERGNPLGNIGIDELDCQQASALEVCVHPAYSSLLDDFVEAADQVYLPLAGHSGLPERLIGGVGHVEDVGGNGTFDLHLYDRQSVEFAVALSLGDLFISPTSSTGSLTASQATAKKGSE